MLDKDEFARMMYKNKEKKEMERKKEIEEEQKRSKVALPQIIFSLQTLNCSGERYGKDGEISIRDCRGN